MHLQERTIKGKKYTYLDHSFRIGDKIQKASFILEKEKEKYNDKIIERIAKARAFYFKKHFTTFFSQEEVFEIEKEKVFFQIFFNALDKKKKEKIINEFVRIFLANSMELEGSTITPKLAEKIDNKKNALLPESDIELYNNSKKALSQAMKIELRSIIQFKRLHKEIYQGIFPHTGEFKKQINTFGYIDKAKTAPPEKVRSQLKKIIEEYRKKNIYPFLKPLLFHSRYQKIHPFIDGNNRLGRILLVAQMFKLNYPPLMFKGDMSFQIRETLVEYCNNHKLDFCRLAMEHYLLTAKKFWRPMIKKFLL